MFGNFYGNNITITIKNNDTGEVRELKGVRATHVEYTISCYEQSEIVLHLISDPPVVAATRGSAKSFKETAGLMEEYIRRNNDDRQE